MLLGLSRSFLCILGGFGASGCKKQEGTEQRPTKKIKSALVLWAGQGYNENHMKAMNEGKKGCEA